MSTLKRQAIEPTVAHRCKSGCMSPVSWRVADTRWWKQHEQCVERPVGITFLRCDRHIETTLLVRGRVWSVLL